MQIEAAQLLTDEYRAELRKAGFAKLYALSVGDGEWIYQLAAYDPEPLVLHRTATAPHAGNMCKAVMPRPPAPPRPLLLRLSLLVVALWARLRSWYGLLVFLAARLVQRRALATECQAVPMLTGGPSLLGWRAPIAVGMAFRAEHGEVSIVPAAAHVAAGEAGCLSTRERARRRLAYRYPTTVIKLNGDGGWIVSTAGTLARFLGVRTG